MEKPLVSIVVISYNSAKTIVETLNSIREQTYSPLELIVSDDASADETVAIARAWLNENRSRFVRTNLVVAEKNGGIPSNCNRGINSAQGEFIKSIAADDILLPDCIQDNVSFMQENPNAEVCISRMQEFAEKNGSHFFFEERPISQFELDFFASEPKEQYKALLSRCFIDAPAAFFKSSLAKSSPYDEQFPAMEDWPKWLELTSAGIKLHLLNKRTVLYRIGNGISSHPQKEFYKKSFMESQKLFYIISLRQQLLENKMNERVAKFDRDFLLFDFIIAAFNNKKSLHSLVVRFFFRLFLHLTIR